MAIKLVVAVTDREWFDGSEVSRRIREEFENGRNYYAMHGALIAVPERADRQPARDTLTWHNENRFLG